MKKSKVILVMVLSLMLVASCMMTSTFSWFQHSDVQQGNRLVWNSDVYNISVSPNGSIKATTKRADNSASLTAINSIFTAKKRIDYVTVIENYSAHPQTVSLFCTLKSSGAGCYFGVNEPIKTYKEYIVNSDTEVPLALNMKIEAAKIEGGSVVPAKKTVKWFINNTSDNAVTVNVTEFYMTV